MLLLVSKHEHSKRFEAIQVKIQAEYSDEVVPPSRYLPIDDHEIAKTRGNKHVTVIELNGG